MFSLPPELLTPGSTELKKSGELIVHLTGGPSEQAASARDIRVGAIHIESETEEIEVNKITVPIDNCGGSAPIAQDYIQTQTFIHEYRAEAGAGVKLDVPFPVGWPKLVLELQAKYGFEQGQVDSKTVAYHMEAEPGTNQVYIITWREVWESGIADVMAGSDLVQVPFKVKTNMIYEVDSTKLDCK